MLCVSEFISIQVRDGKTFPAKMAISQGELMINKFVLQSAAILK